MSVHAAVAGLQTEFLMQLGVEMHLGDCGVDHESASHTRSTSCAGASRLRSCWLW